MIPSATGSHRSKRSEVKSFLVRGRFGVSSGASQGSELPLSPPSFSAGEKPGFLAPRDLPKHTPLISKSQSLRSVHGAGSWARPQPDEERPPRLPRPVQRTQSVPAGRPARRRPSAGPRPRPKSSLRTGPAPRGRPWTGASASLPRKPSVPWQRQLDQPRDRDQALGTHRPVGKVRSSSGLCTEWGRRSWKDKKPTGLGSDTELAALCDPGTS